MLKSEMLVFSGRSKRGLKQLVTQTVSLIAKYFCDVRWNISIKLQKRRRYLSYRCSCSPLSFNQLALMRGLFLNNVVHFSALTTTSEVLHFAGIKVDTIFCPT